MRLCVEKDVFLDGKNISASRKTFCWKRYSKSFRVKMKKMVYRGPKYVITWALGHLVTL